MEAGEPVNDGDGFLFVSHTGEIFPPDFPPVAAGSIRDEELVEVCRNSDLFVRLRDKDQLKGKCGVCPLTKVCGGSRARDFAGDGGPVR